MEWIGFDLLNDVFICSKIDLWDLLVVLHDNDGSIRPDFTDQIGEFIYLYYVDDVELSKIWVGGIVTRTKFLIIFLAEEELENLAYLIPSVHDLIAHLLLIILSLLSVELELAIMNE